MTTAGKVLSFLVFAEQKYLVAQGLEYDFGTQARAWNDLFYEVQRTVVAHLAAAAKTSREPFESLPSPPAVFARRATYLGAEILWARIVTDEQTPDGRKIVVRVTRGRVEDEGAWFVTDGPDEETSRYAPAPEGA